MTRIVLRVAVLMDGDELLDVTAYRGAAPLEARTQQTGQRDCRASAAALWSWNRPSRVEASSSHRRPEAVRRLRPSCRGVYRSTMRSVRRLTAALVSVLTIHLGIASAVMTCPLGDSAAIAGATTAERGSPMMARAHPHPGESSTSDHGEMPKNLPMQHHSRGSSNCGTSCTPAGCASMSHCGAGVFRGTATETRPAFDVAAAPARTYAAIPHSISTAPEPPPPRV